MQPSSTSVELESEPSSTSVKCPHGSPTAATYHASPGIGAAEHTYQAVPRRASRLPHTGRHPDHGPRRVVQRHGNRVRSLKLVLVPPRLQVSTARALEIRRKDLRPQRRGRRQPRGRRRRVDRERVPEKGGPRRASRVLPTPATCVCSGAAARKCIIVSAPRSAGSSASSFAEAAAASSV